jgi:hypothetical protein
MARTKQTVTKSTRGKAPKQAPETPPKPTSATKRDKEEDRPQEQAHAAAKKHGSQRAAVARAIREQQGLLKSVSIVSCEPQTDSPAFDRPCCCPCCDYKISMAEMLAGFSQEDPLDVKTTCPSCAGRFMGTLMVNGGAFVVALGPAQALDQYRQLLENTSSELQADKLAKNFFTRVPYIAWNAYWHSPSSASAKLNVFEKVGAFLALVL